MISKDDILQITAESNSFLSHPSEHVFMKRVVEEYELMSRYKGREIFELLQNIDDAGQSDSAYLDNSNAYASLSIVQDISGIWLEVCNCGKPFTLDTLKRLCEGKVSAKDEVSDTEQYIGYKGIGFRSVLNLADVVEIHSGHSEDTISVRFSHEYASRQLDFIRINPHISRQIDSTAAKGYEPKYPMLKAPEPIDRHSIEPFDTMIRLKLRDNDTVNKVKHEMANIEKEILLFLPNINRVVFSDGETKRTISRSEEGDGIVTLSDTCGTNIRYRLWKCEKHLNVKMRGGKSLRMAIAIPADLNICLPERPVYSFFPVLHLPSPFPAILHATFILTDNRNDLDLSSDENRKNNGEIWRLLLQFYVETICLNIPVSHRLRLLTPLDFYSRGGIFAFQGNLSQLNSEEYYMNLLRKYEIICNVNGSGISPSTSPILFSDVPESFHGPIFDTVAAISDTRLKDMARCIYPDCIEREPILLHCIDMVSQEWTPSTRAIVFKWWHQQGFSKLPKLLRIQSGDFVTDPRRPLFLSGGIDNVPDWAKIDVLSAADEEALLNAYSYEIKDQKTQQEQSGRRPDSSKRILPALIPKVLVNLMEQSSVDALISPVNNSVDDDINRAIDFMQWLYNEYSKLKNGFSDTVRSLTFNLPGADLKVHPSDKLYLDSDYGCDLCGKLMRYIPGFSPIYYLKGASDNADFFNDIGVCRMPTLKEMSTKTGDPDNYIKYLLNKNPINEYASEYFCSYTSTIGLEQIIAYASETDIMRWLIIEDRLTAKYESRGQLKYQPYDGRRRPVTHIKSEGMKAYMLYMFSHTPWININGNKMSPDDLLLSEYDYPIDHINSKWIADMAQSMGCNPMDLRHLLFRLGVKESPIGLSSKRFYNLLLSLPYMIDSDLSAKLSRRIYRDIIDNGAKPVGEKRECFYEKSEEKERFFKEGKVLSEDYRGRQSYMPVSEVRFSSTAVFQTPGLHLIKVPPRSGNKSDFLNILGVGEYSQTSEVYNYSEAICNADFQRDFRQFLPCIMAYRNNKRSDAARLDVRLVNNVDVKVHDHNAQNFISDFEPYRLFHKNNRQWLIYVGDITDYNDINKVELALRLEQIFYVFLDFPGQDFLGRIRALFLCDQSGREVMVRADMGSSDDLDDAKSELKNVNEIRHAILNYVDPTLIDKTSILVNEINWLDIADVEQQRKIAKLLLLTGMDIITLSQLTDTRISIVRYNESILDRIWHNSNGFIRGRLHSWSATNPAYRKLFMTHSAMFQKPAVDESVLQSVGIDSKLEDIVTHYIEETMNRIGVPSDITPTPEDEIEKIYNKNLILAQNLLYNKDISEVLNNPEVESLLYFDDTQTISETIRYLLEKETADLNNIDDRIDDSVIIKIVDNIIETDLNPADKPDFTISGSGKDVSPARITKEHKRNTRQGDMAEYLVVRKLTDSSWKEVEQYVGTDYKVFWVSGASRRFRPVKNDPRKYSTSKSSEQCGDGVGYDIRVVSSDGSRMLNIEVKSSSARECSFIMSAGEYTKACQSDIPTRIVFVSNLHIDSPDCHPGITFVHNPISSAFARYPAQYVMIFKH